MSARRMPPNSVGTTPEGLRRLFGRLVAYMVDWDHAKPYEGTKDRGRRPLNQANVVSSQIEGTDLHIVALDIDGEAYLVPSSTPGHSHLYINQPMPWPKYEAILRALTDGGVLEPGYTAVSVVRGHTDLRLPWIRKPVVPLQRRTA